MGTNSILFKNAFIKEVNKWWTIIVNLLIFKEIKEYYGNRLNNYDITIATVMDYYKVEYWDSVFINIQIFDYLLKA